MTIKIGERVDKAVKEEQSHLSLTRARERAKVHQDTHSGIRHQLDPDPIASAAWCRIQASDGQKGIWKEL